MVFGFLNDGPSLMAPFQVVGFQVRFRTKLSAKSTVLSTFLTKPSSLNRALS